MLTEQELADIRAKAEAAVSDADNEFKYELRLEALGLALDPPTTLALLDEIARVNAENEQLREALKPFAAAANNFDAMPIKDPEQWSAYGGIRTTLGEPSGPITVAALRRARAALTKEEKP